MVLCSDEILEATLEALRDSGRKDREGIVLWLASRGTLPASRVVQTFIPKHEAGDDYFYVSPEAMRDMFGYLRTHSLALVAQVHSHPRNAFHSQADDKWALVGHVGGLSLVVPNFALNVTAENFRERVAFYRLGFDSKWEEVPRGQIDDAFEITK